MTRRAGGWILGLVIILTMAGGFWLALRRVFPRVDVSVALLPSPARRDPSHNAMVRGALAALKDAGGRAGRHRVSLEVREPGAVHTTPGIVAAWIGTSEALLARGHQQPRPFTVSVIDTYPIEPTECYRISPGCGQQGSSAARWAKRIGATRVFLLCDSPSPRSKAISAAFETSAKALGIPLEGPADAAPATVDRILASKADLVFYSGEEAPYATTAKIFAALREKGFQGRLVTGETDPEVSFLATRSGPVDGTWLVSPFAPAPTDVAARMGFVPGPHVTAGYFAMKAVLDAIERVNSVEENDLHRAAAALQATRFCALYVAKNGVYEFVELLE